MKIKGINFLLLLGIVFFGFTADYSRKINKCFISFNPDAGLVAATPDKLPKTAQPFRSVPTDDGDKFISRNAGYRILYNNDKGAPFVNLKVERCDNFSFNKDKQNLLSHFNFLISNGVNMASAQITESDYSGFKVYGFSRNSIESGSTLGTYVLFAEPNMMVYFYFNNLQKEYRNFESVEDYQIQRDDFIEGYTNHLKACLEK